MSGPVAKVVGEGFARSRISPGGFKQLTPPGGTLKHLEMVRNICAHHSRLRNRNFTRIPKLPSKVQAQMPAGFNRDPESLPEIYNTLALLDYVDEFVSKNQRLPNSVGQLLDAYPNVDPKQMGFPGPKPKTM